MDTKKFFISILLAAAAVSCFPEEIDDPQKQQEQQQGIKDGEMVFHASFQDDAASRTVRQADGKVLWSAGEQISVFWGSMGSGGAKFVSTNTDAAATADFKGTLPAGSGDCIALYPYNSGAQGSNGDNVTVDFTNIQKAVPGSVPDDLYIAVARSSTADLSFKHVLGGIRFSVVSGDISKVTLSSNGGEVLASDRLSVNMGSDGKAVVTAYNEGFEFIEFAPSDGGFFTPGADYYIVTMPAEMSDGFNMIFERENGDILIKDVAGPVSISGATFISLPDADGAANWHPAKLTYSPREVYMGYKGGSFTIDVTYYGVPHVDSASEWIKASGSYGDPKVGCKYSFIVDENDGDERIGLITVCDDSNCYYVTVTQEKGPLKLNHHSLGMRFTATWCGYCPMMNTAFGTAKESLGDKFNIVNFHCASSDLAFSGSSTLEGTYKIGGYPTGIIDGRSLIENYGESYTASLVINAVQETERTYFTTTSAGIKSTVSGRDVTVDVDVLAGVPDKYKITVLLLENGIISPQADYNLGIWVNDYVHNNTARMALTSISGDEFTVEEAATVTNFTYSATIPAAYKIDNMSVLVYISKPFGQQAVVRSDNYGNWYIDNSRIVPVGVSCEPELLE